ncbi:hypothetical protein TSOC_012793 [Tetrabaena socialis]|uniref:Uncharacterized protein n=1 Tax=Tetrabaena socialis TaxID=47790 RepID=A0A2J7ZM36_9CHLO|nr:hypothetical protein TSOC_012793 [Tetrabaena socialis]|eukprot:PNH01331.1 hypothetical protein TSOC_012793 [Tetrabaena socialis]
MPSVQPSQLPGFIPGTVFYRTDGEEGRKRTTFAMVVEIEEDKVNDAADKPAEYGKFILMKMNHVVVTKPTRDSPEARVQPDATQTLGLLQALRLSNTPEAKNITKSYIGQSNGRIGRKYDKWDFLNKPYYGDEEVPVVLPVRQQEVVTMQTTQTTTVVMQTMQTLQLQ